MRTLLKFVLVVCLAFVGSENSFLHATSVLSYHNDSSSSGVNSTETVLTPSNLTVNTFSKRYATTVDGQQYAQPLYVPSVVVTSGPQAGTHNLAFVATQHDSLYAIDADSGAIVWQTSFLTTGLPGATSITSVPAADTASTNISPEVGICGTPVIDGTTNLLYVAAKTKQIINGATATPHYVYTVYKIDITNGNATPNANIVGSTIIANTTYNGTTFTSTTATDPTAPQDVFVFGTGDGSVVVNGQSRVYFNSLRELNRPGLLLSGGSVYIAFGSHGDNGPYHGWLLGFNKNTLAVTGVINFTPNGGLGGIWGGGAIPVVDASGNIYTITGNGTFDGYNNGGVAAGLDINGFPVNGNYGDSIIKVSADPTTSVGNQNKNGWGLKIADYFSPFNNQALDSTDSDLGSGGCVLLPDSAGSVAHPHLLVGAGKQGNVYLIDRDNMGKFMATTDNVVQSQKVIPTSFSTPAFFNGHLYWGPSGDTGKLFNLSNANMSTTQSQTPDSLAFPGSTPSISANGTTNGVVWMIEFNSNQLRAYSATNLGTELWTSALAPNNRDQFGSAVKFTSPTVADGRVLVGTMNSLVVYGPPSAVTSPPAAPTNLVATAVSGLEIDLSWTDNANNESGFYIEQSTDGVNFTQIASVGVNITTYPVNTNLQVGTTYYYRVRAYNSFQTLSYSAYTNIAQATTTAQPPTLNFSSGFVGSTSQLQYNSSAKIVNSRAELTDGGLNETASIWSSSVQNIQKFSTQFTFQLTNPNADGFTFAIQNNSAAVVGANGAGLGYSGLLKSIAVKFDIYNNAGEGVNSTGLYVNGALPFTPATDLTPSGLNLHSGDTFQVVLTYDGTTLTEKITDTVTSVTATYAYTINIPTTIGSNTAYVGFTGGSGGLGATQDILTWIFSSLPTAAPAAPTALAATAVSGTQINLSWTDNSTNESGFVILQSTSATGPFTQIGVVGAGVTTYMNTALLPNTTYYYEVYATNSAGNSVVTNVASALTPVPPITPTNAQAVAITTTTISMTWTNNATNATAYNIFRSASGANHFVQVATLSGTATSYTDTGLTPGTSYDYHVQAYNIAGFSDFSGFTATTLSSSALPIVTASSTGPVAVNGITVGQITLTRNAPFSASLPVTYTVSGTANGGTDYTALSGSATIPVGAASVTIPVTALPGATTNSTVIATIASTSTYLAGSPASASVVIEGTTYNTSAQTTYAVTSVPGTTGGSVSLTFPGLPGSPTGVAYVWYLNGVAFATSSSNVYTITNAITAQSGTYGVYAYAPGGITGNATWNVTISNPPVVITTSVGSLAVNDGSTGTFTVSLATAPLANVTVNVSISGTPALTVTPATITMTPTNYQNQPVAVSAAAINSNDSNRSASVSLTGGTSNATVAVTDVISDTQTAANLTGTTYPLTGSNIGTGSGGDSSVHASGNWWVDGSGTGGISGSADSFHFESQSFTGNFQMVVQLQNLVATGATSPLAGLMIRQSTDPAAPFLALAGTAATSGGYSLISRTASGAASTTTVTSGTNLTYTYPAAWLMLTRVGNVLHAFVSSDGNTYYEVTNPSTGVTWTGITSALSIGVFSSSGSTANARAVMSNFSINSVNFTDTDIGSPALAGSATLNGGIYTVKGGGADIWNTSDQFNYEWQTVSGDNTMIAHVDSIQNTSAWAKAGLMFRNSTAAGDAFVAVYESPNSQVELQWRDALNNGAGWSGSQVASTVAANWLKLVKVGTTYTAYYATTTTTPAAANWILIGTHTTVLTNATYLAGMAVTAHDNTQLNTSVFSNYSVQNASTQPLALTDLDIGTPGIAGSAALNAGIYTINGGGADIWGTSDQFNYAYQSNTTDKTIITHIDSIQNTSAWAKAGVMFRNSTIAGAAFVAVYENPGNLVELQWRDADNFGAGWSGSQVSSAVAANWLKLVKSGTTFTAYYATTTATPAATDWILIAVHTTTFTNSTYLGGLAVTAHNNGVLCTSVFSGYSQQ